MASKNVNEFRNVQRIRKKYFSILKKITNLKKITDSKKNHEFEFLMYFRKRLSILNNCDLEKSYQSQNKFTYLKKQHEFEKIVA